MVPSAVTIVAAAATPTTASQIPYPAEGSTSSVRATVKGTIPATAARVPKNTPVTVSSSPSRPTPASTWPGVAPASRCWPNSRLRYEVAAYSVLISITQAKTAMIPTTTKLRVSRFLSSTDCVSPAASMWSFSTDCMYSVATEMPTKRTIGISTPDNCAARCRSPCTVR